MLSRSSLDRFNSVSILTAERPSSSHGRMRLGV